MGRYSGLMLLSDYDGTLTDNSGKVPEANLSAVREFMDGGGVFTVCTGRTMLGFACCLPLPINAPVLVGNGSLCYDYRDGSVLFYEGIGDDAVGFVREAAERFPRICIELYHLHRGYLLHPNQGSVDHLNSQKIPFDFITDPVEAKRPWQKIMFCCGTEGAAFQEWMRERAYPGLYNIPSTGNFVEVMREGVNKGEAMLRLAASFGIGPENVFCAGDGNNDPDMLTAAESYCPCDAEPEALAAAAHVGCSRDEGILAYAIKHFTEER